MSEYRWLTDLSRQFLERDYLVNKQTVEKRVDVICDAAERILNKPGFADAFKDNLKKGWYSLSSPIWSNFGTKRGLPISCVVGETWINTKENGGKQAKDICIGDEVLTHKGRYKKITEIIKTEKKNDIYKLKISNRMTNLYLTGTHLVLTNLGWIRVDELDEEVHLVAINRHVDFEETDYKINLKNFCNYDFLEKDGRFYKKGSENVRKDRRVEIVGYYASPFSEIVLDEEVAWALGLWFAEGSLSTNDRDLPNGARVTVNVEDEKRYGDQWLEIMCRRFGVNGNTYMSRVERKDGTVNHWYNANVNSIVIGNFFAAFGPNCKEKTIPNWLITAPKNILKSFLDAFLLGDGTIRKRGGIKCTLSNPKLILQIYQIGLKLGLDMSLQMQEKAGKLATTSYVYTVEFRPTKLGFSRFTGNNAVAFNDGLYYSRIRLLEKTSKVKTVYDFTVEEDHSFSAAGVILHNCFGSMISDDMNSILYTQSEVGMMTKYGGGTSAYFGKLRGRGEVITDNGESSGAVHFMQLFETIIQIISQGSSRRGQFAAYLPIDHKDINEFLGIRSEGHPLQDISFGVCVSDMWMEEMIAGDAAKRKTWAKVLESRSNKGYPYIFFTDNANKGTVDCYKDKGMEITHSNLCVIGNQRVVSDRGLKTAKQLYKEGGKLKLFDNNEVVDASPMLLVEKDADVYKITLDNGMTHTVTAYHKVKVRNKKRHWSGYFHSQDVAICDLKIGDLVAVQTQKGLFGNNHQPKKAFLLGLYQGDGTQTKKEVFLDVWENDFDLLDEIQDDLNFIYVENGMQIANNREYPIPSFHNCVVAQSSVKKKRLPTRALKKLGFKKGCIPDWLWEGDEETHWAYVRGLLYTDGTVGVSKSKGQPIQLSLSSVNKPFLQKVQLILANLGMKSSIRLLRNSGRTLLPDGKGSKKFYKTKTCWRLIVGNKNDALEINRRIKFLDRKDVVIENRHYRDNTKKFYAVKSIKKVKNEDVYCCKVNSNEHHWICNGIVTHNCTEIFLPDNEDESFVCDLSSMNILYFDEWKDTNAVELLVYFLDAVMTEFIDKAKNIDFMKRPVRFAERHRALGIGWLGYHSYLQSKMIPFDCMEAKYANVTIAKNIKEAAYKASAALAKEYGEPEVLKGYGRRNSTLLAIAPTKSSAFILGQVSENTEPNRTNIVIKDLQKGKYTMKNTYLEEVLEKYGKNNEATWSGILKSGGSVQHLDFLSKHEKDVFKTFAEISPKEIIIQAAQRQKYIDQGQSINLMIHPSVPIKDVNALIIEGWRLGIKSYYYQYSVNAAQAFSRDVLSCASCQA